eukprot:c16178_g1_i1.p1 GENE.c16178_g1_i1~~c16178_g1_i1.p1  ORF type:complete len:199 (-),score=16.39 c16178_g1_i1:21-617(-)
MSTEKQPRCLRFPKMRVCGCTIPCPQAIKQVSMSQILLEPSSLDCNPADDGFLFVGPWQASAYHALPRQHKITHVINLSQIDYPRLEGVSYLVVEVDDSPQATLSSHFQSCIDFINDSASACGACLVHCMAGASRSPSIVAAYLISKFKLTAEEALQIVQERHPRAEPNEGFVRQLVEFAQLEAGPRAEHPVPWVVPN